MSTDNVIPIGGGAPQPVIDEAKVILSRATGVLDLLINTFDELLGEQGRKDLSNLECNLGLRDGTLTTSLHLILGQVDQALGLLDRRADD